MSIANISMLAAVLGSVASALAQVDLQAPYLDAPESHGAGHVLQRDRSARELVILGLCRERAIQSHRQLRPLGGDFVGVPLAAGIDDGEWFGDVDDGTRAARLIGTLVEDVGLVAGLVGDLFRVLTTHVRS